MRTYLVTGASGTLGSALVRQLRRRGDRVVGVGRAPCPDGAAGTEEEKGRWLVNAQQTWADAEALVAFGADVLVLNAGAIETEIGAAGEPLPEQLDELFTINALFPMRVALAAARSGRSLEVVAVGSIADGSPSCFGPTYHASKIATHYFYSGTAPILAGESGEGVRLRLYRPGAIRGELSRAPMIRLNERGRRVRQRRCEGAPVAERVASHLLDWIESGGAVGTYSEPLSFRALRLVFALAPNLYAKLQVVGWRKASRFVAEEPRAEVERGAPVV